MTYTFRRDLRNAALAELEEHWRKTTPRHSAEQIRSLAMDDLEMSWQESTSYHERIKDRDKDPVLYRNSLILYFTLGGRCSQQTAEKIVDNCILQIQQQA